MLHHYPDGECSVLESAEASVCLWDPWDTTSEVFTPGKIPQKPILPFSRAAQQIFAHSFSESSSLPSLDAISLPGRCVSKLCGSCLASGQASSLQKRQEHACPGP